VSLPSERLSPAFLRLASEVDRRHSSWADADRWEVFKLAIDRAVELDAIFAALVGETDVGVVSAVVVRLIETVPEIDTPRWASMLPEGQLREFAQDRASEVRTLRAVLSGSLGGGVPNVDAWSDWLQRRVASEADELDVLDQLATHGRTRRIRNLARERAIGTRGMGGQRGPRR
jgi:hypothetical protein